MTWLTTKEAAELLRYEISTVRKRAKNGEYKFRYTSSSTGQGGKKMEILLESLPEQAQRAYQNEHGENQIVFNTDFISTKAQKEKGNLRDLAVAEYREFEKNAKKLGMQKKGEIRAAFIKQWNREHDFQITSKSLYDWQKNKKNGKSNIDRRGGYNRGQSKIPEQYKEMFDSLFLQQTKPSVADCYNEVRCAANKNGETIPGIKAFYNHANNMNPSMLIFAREGKKAFEDKCMPYMERDFSSLVPNEFWVSDHHLWDVFVRVPDNKGGWKVERPWGTYWMDMRARKVMASIIRIESPNSDVVLCSFGLAAEHFGIPDRVYLDNGKDYKARDMFYPEGHYLSDDDREKAAKSLAANLQIKVTYAIPYNAKAKPIERMFRTFEEKFVKKFPSYAGRNAKQRPEDLKDLNIMEYITLEEFIEFHNQFVYRIYNESAHSGDAMNGRSPNKVYGEIPFTVRKTTKEALYFSLMRIKEERTVQRNGITYKGIHYYNENCINHIGKKVVPRYKPTNPELLYVFDTDENFLFIAEQVQKQGFNLEKEDYQRENHRKKLAKQIALNSYTKDNTIRSTEAIKERLQREAESLEKAEKAKPKTFKIIRNDKLEENIRRIAMSDMERNYEDVIKQNSARKKAAIDKNKEIFKNRMLELERKTRKEQTDDEQNESSAYTNFG